MGLFSIAERAPLYTSCACMRQNKTDIVVQDLHLLPHELMWKRIITPTKVSVSTAHALRVPSVPSVSDIIFPLRDSHISITILYPLCVCRQQHPGPHPLHAGLPPNQRAGRPGQSPAEQAWPMPGHVIDDLTLQTFLASLETSFEAQSATARQGHARRCAESVAALEGLLYGGRAV